MRKQGLGLPRTSNVPLNPVSLISNSLNEEKTVREDKMLQLSLIPLKPRDFNLLKSVK